MSLYKDFIVFVDSGSIIPYFVDGAKYVLKPTIFSETFVYDFKEYYKRGSSYFVGVSFSKMVRPIHAGDYNRIKALFLARNSSDSVTKLQLTFSF